MKIETRKEGDAVIVSACGRLDGAGAPVLEAELSALAVRGVGLVVLDCGRIDYISSAGLRALLIGAKTCLHEGGQLAVAALQPHCRAVMEASGLLFLLNYQETPEAVLAATARSPAAAEDRAALDIGVLHEGSAVVLSLRGRLDGSNAPALIARMSGALEDGVGDLVLDCAGMSYISSAGLRVLLVGAKTCRQEGGRFALAALAPQCRSVLEMSGFLSVIEHHETCEAALAALGRSA